MYVKIMIPVLAVILAVASAGMVGGPMDADINDEDVQNALQYAVAQYNMASNDMYVRQVSEVIKAEKQLVAGLKYTFTVKMARTSCRKSGVETQCEFLDNSMPSECTIVVWSKPWMKSIKVLENTCP